MNSRKYMMTKGVQKNIDFLLVLMLFDLREVIPVKEYLTIVHVKSVGGDKCVISLEQEQPEYKIQHEIDYPIEIDVKLYIIDEGMHLTCMYPEEY